VNTEAAYPTLERPRAPAEKLRLGIEALVLYGRVRLLMRGGTALPDLVAALRNPRRLVGSPSGDQLTDNIAAVRFGRAVTKALRPLPADTRCLMRSLVLVAVLARRGMDCTLVIGVMPGEKFAAHAWVERDGQTVLGAHSEPFERLLEV
jgi:hypothetical protein